MLGAALCGLFGINFKDLLNEFLVSRLDLGDGFCNCHAHVDGPLKPCCARRPIASTIGRRVDLNLRDRGEAEFGGLLADFGLVDRLHDAVLHQQVFEFVHGDRRRYRAVADIGVDLRRQVAVMPACADSGANSMQVMRRSSACCTISSRGTK